MLLASCTQPSVRLDYRFVSDRTLTYRWTIDATTRIDSAIEQSTRRLRVVMEALEEVRSFKPDGVASVRWTLRTVQRSEDGIEVEPTPAFSVDLEVRPDGTVAGIRFPTELPGLEVDRLLSEAYPRLPGHRVSIGEEWSAPLEVQSTATSLQFEGNGKLVGFELKGRRRLARIRIERNGTVTSKQPVERVQLSITGTASVSTRAQIDVDAGVLVTTESRSTSSFEVTSASGTREGTQKILVITMIELLD